MWKLTIKEVMDSKGISMQEFADGLGVTLSSAYRYLSNDNITLNKLHQIAGILRCTIKDLFEEDGEETQRENEFLWDKDRERQLRLLIRSFDSVAKDITDMSEKAKELLDDSVL